MTKRPIVSKQSLDLQSNHFLRRKPAYPLGASFGELDYLRGWKDDFFGDVLADQYDTAINGAGSVAATLQDAAHGGVARLIAGPAAGRYSRLWLGNAAGNYDTLDADEGWIQICRMRIETTTNINARFGVADAARNNEISCGSATASNANWNIITRTGGGAWNIVNSGVALDTDWHVHILFAYPITGGLQVDHWLDGSKINTNTASMPTAVLTPIVYIVAVAAAARWMDVDLWDTIPRNL